MRRHPLAKMIPLAGFVAAACTSDPAPSARVAPDVAVRAIAAALRRGHPDEAERVLRRALPQAPRHGALRRWSAYLHEMRWREEMALADLEIVARTSDRGGLTEAEVEGQIGDLLFRLGRFGEAEEHLERGKVGPRAALRGALAALCPHLPYRRTEVSMPVTELPLLGGGLPEMVWSVGGKQRAFVLDTGASLSTLTRSLAAELGVAPILPAGFGEDGRGRRFPVWVGVLGSLALGEVELGPVPVLIVEDHRLALHDDFGRPLRPARGLVGLDVLLRFEVTIDPRRRSVTVADPTAGPPRRSVPCLRVGGRLLTRVSIDGHPLWMQIDTGASHSSLTEEGIAALPGAGRRALDTYRRLRSPGGRALAVREVRGSTLRVSDVRFPGVDLPIVSRENDGVFPVHGVLGADLLMRTRVVLGDGRLRMEAQ